jgi:hypothetical protein
MGSSDSGGGALSHPPEIDISVMPDFQAFEVNFVRPDRLVTAGAEYGSLSRQSTSAGEDDANVPGLRLRSAVAAQ